MSQNEDRFSGKPLSRRRLIAGGMGTAVLISSFPIRSFADQAALDTMTKSIFGDTIPTMGRVKLTLPPIAENGYSVPVDISVESPMTEDDFVRKIALLSPKNPIPLISTYTLSPRTGKAEVSTRIRLAGTQTLTVIAEMNDGSLWSGSAQTVVTLAACVIN